jgi:hypothetical protein
MIRARGKETKRTKIKQAGNLKNAMIRERRKDIIEHGKEMDNDKCR